MSSGDEDLIQTSLLECAKKLERKLRHSPRRETDPRVRWLHGKLEALDKADTAFVRLSWVPTRVEMLNGEFFQLAMPVWGVKKQNSELGVELWVSDPYVYPDSKLSPTQAQSLLGLECHVLTLLQSEAREAPDNAWVRYRTLQERANVHISGHPCR